jgi:hypothetical protein
MDITFYFDPLCPWCWMTDTWVRSVAEDRNLNITHVPISLKLKNGDMPEPWSTRASNSLRMLRVVEHMRANGAGGKVGAVYKHLGTAVHKDELLSEDNPDIKAAIVLALEASELDTEWADQMDNDDLTAAVQKSTDAAIALSGEDVGTPIIAFKDKDGKDAALFGPVISQLPPTHEEALELWDAYVVFATKPYFWELKRTRTEGPNVESTF